MKRSLNKILMSLCALLLCCMACTSDPKTEGSGAGSGNVGTGGTGSQPNQEVVNGTTNKGVEYSIYKGGNSREKVKIGDYLHFHMEYKNTRTDSIIYSSYKYKKPVRSRLSSSMFRGTMTEGLTQMYEGDSAVFQIPAKLIHYGKYPTFIQEGDILEYRIKLKDIEASPGNSPESK